MSVTHTELRRAAVPLSDGFEAVVKTAPTEYIRRQFEIVKSWGSNRQMLSTNARRQPEKTENSRPESWGPGRTMMVQAEARNVVFPTGETGDTKYSPNVWDMGVAQEGCCQRKLRAQLVSQRCGSPRMLVYNYLSITPANESNLIQKFRNNAT